MKIKKIISVALCTTMALSLVGCSFNPKNALNTLLHGNSQNNNNGPVTDIAANSDKINKDAVFKETSTSLVSSLIISAALQRQTASATAVLLSMNIPKEWMREMLNFTRWIMPKFP